LLGPYRLDVTRAAARDLTSLKRHPPDQDLLGRIDTAIGGLAQIPRPPGASKLTGAALWRIVVGDYRVIYAIDDEQRVVTVARVRHRREVYRES
jgi:mRNA interferase RelE/StbE